MDVLEESTVAAKRRSRLQDERIAELLDIAAGVFIAEGFAAASTNKIARLANASKTTFYSRFPTKEDLFVAVIDRRMTRIFEQVARFPQGETIEHTLQLFGANLLEIALSPEQVALIRVISMEAAKYPDLARRFYEIGPGRGESALAAYLASQTEAGLLRAEDPLVMAGHLMSLLTGSSIRWFVLGFASEAPMGQPLDRHIESAVSLFLRAYSRT